MFNLHDAENIIEGDSNMLQFATKYYKDFFGPHLEIFFLMILICGVVLRID
jgi:hypothetical protein